MATYTATLGKAERVAYNLRELYQRYGYAQYKMSKFEEYDLYAKNKSFLQSSNIITFTDTDGKLMALKPDVTLSIVKNGKDTGDGVRKVYYNENVYRVPRGDVSYREIMQAGLECMGNIDSYCVVEVLSLAAKSLSEISDQYVLDVSDIGIISSLIDELAATDEEKREIMTCVGEKNLSAIEKLCAKDESAAATLKALICMRGDCAEMLEILKGRACYGAACELARAVEVLKGQFGSKIRIDFSVTDDARYYCGIVFKGFVRGIPTAVLSGGRYDGLVRRMKKNGGAIGFAVYLDKIDAIDEISDEYDIDTFVLYSEGDELAAVYTKVDELVSAGQRTLAGKIIPERLKYKTLLKMGGKE